VRRTGAQEEKSLLSAPIAQTFACVSARTSPHRRLTASQIQRDVIILAGMLHTVGVFYVLYKQSKRRLEGLMASLGLSSVKHKSSPWAASASTTSASTASSTGTTSTPTKTATSTTSKVTSPPSKLPNMEQMPIRLQAHQPHRLRLHRWQMSILSPSCHAVALGLVPENVKDVVVGGGDEGFA
jgi:hypothetical protein